MVNITFYDIRILVEHMFVKLHRNARKKRDLQYFMLQKLDKNDKEEKNHRRMVVFKPSPYVRCTLGIR